VAGFGPAIGAHAAGERFYPSDQKLLLDWFLDLVSAVYRHEAVRARSPGRAAVVGRRLLRPSGEIAMIRSSTM
jgi:hypothetical protein